MTFKRVFIRVLCIMLLIACLSSCSEDAQPTEGKEQKLQSKQNSGKSSMLKAQGSKADQSNKTKGNKETAAKDSKNSTDKDGASHGRAAEKDASERRVAEDDASQRATQDVAVPALEG